MLESCTKWSPTLSICLTPNFGFGLVCWFVCLRMQRAGELVVDTLLIPKQVSTADTCHTIDEAATFEFQSARGLMTLGWVGDTPFPHPLSINEDVKETNKQNRKLTWW
jgi:hypothetical protein